MYLLRIVVSLLFRETNIYRKKLKKKLNTCWFLKKFYMSTIFFVHFIFPEKKD